MSTGDIVDGPYATRAKEYVWSKMRDAFPRGITPTDSDAEFESNWCFFFVEGKTQGKKIDKGQALEFKRKMLSLPERKAVFVIAEHPPLDKVDMNAELTSVRWTWRVGSMLAWALPLPLGSLRKVVEFFFADAESGRLHPEHWYSNLVAPFEPEVAS